MTAVQDRPAQGAGPPSGDEDLESALSPTTRPHEVAARTVLFLCAAFTIFTTTAIVFVLLAEGWLFFREVPVSEFLGDSVWDPNIADRFGVWPLVWGTLLVTVIALAVALPLGLGAATYLSEYASPKVRKVLKPLLEILAGVPTVVYGFFALNAVTPVVQFFFPEADIFNALSAGIVMGVMIIPTIASLSEDAMTAVPRALREGAYGLGATRRVVATRIVIPSAFSGIAAAAILGISRAIGETMIVTIAAGSTPNLFAGPLESVQTMTAAIAQKALGESSQGTVDFYSIFAVAFALFLLTLSANIISAGLVRKFRRGYE